jgi:hypothetical protein
MKTRKYLLFFWLIGISLLFGCSLGLKDLESNFSIKISGTTGLKFKGHYAIAATVSNPDLQNVAGTVPAQYQGKGAMALCLFRKTSPGGSLKVEILKDEKVVAQGESIVPYGVVSLKTSLPGKDNILIQILKRFSG